MKFETIKRRKDFDRLYSEGTRLNCKNLRLAVLLTDDSRDILRVGFVINKKIGKAVERNRVRRILKEIFRKIEKKNKKSIDVLCMANRTITDSSFIELKDQIHESLQSFLFKK